MEALVIAKKIVELAPDNLDARLALAEVYIARRSYTQARQQLDEALRLAPAHKRALQLLDEISLLQVTQRRDD